VGDELRQARAAARHARLAALRAVAEAGAAARRGEHAAAVGHHALAASYQAMGDAYRQRETAFATTMDDRSDWEHATRRQRQLAVAAAAELRRRHPNQPWPPLRSAEPEPRHDSRALTPAVDMTQTARRIEDLAARHREFGGRLAERQRLMIPAQDPDFEDIAPAFPAWTAPARDAILQPPKPQIQPSQQIMQQIANRDPDREVGD
jgi:hypothetical protein